MANSNSPRGLVPIKRNEVEGVERLWVSSAYTAEIGVGTPLVQVAGGFVEAMAVATAADQSWVGVSLERRAGSSGKTEQIAVDTNPNRKFLVQSSVTTNGIALIGASVAFAFTTSRVNTTTGLSIDTVSGAGTTAAAPLRVVGLHRRVGLDADENAADWGSNADIIVQPIAGLHQRSAETGV
jgi:hypothetical protein